MIKPLPVSNFGEELAWAEAACGKAFYERVVKLGKVNGETCVQTEVDLPTEAVPGQLCWVLDDEALWVCWTSDKNTVWVHTRPSPYSPKVIVKGGRGR